SHLSDVSQGGATKPDERLDVRLGGIFAAMQTLEQRWPEHEDEQRCCDSGDDQLRPEWKSDESHQEADGAAEGENQKGEIDVEQLDHEEHRNQYQPADPRPLCYQFDEDGCVVHGALLLSSTYHAVLTCRRRRSRSLVKGTRRVLSGIF